jgi:hypothetical protein
MPRKGRHCCGDWSLVCRSPFCCQFNIVHLQQKALTMKLITSTKWSWHFNAIFRVYDNILFTSFSIVTNFVLLGSCTSVFQRLFSYCILLNTDSHHLQAKVLQCIPNSIIVPWLKYNVMKSRHKLTTDKMLGIRNHYFLNNAHTN